MKAMPKILIVVVLIAAVAGVLYLKRTQSIAVSAPVLAATETTAEAQTAEKPAPAGEATPSEPKKEGSEESLPRLVDLGAGKCIPCKMMAPILEELKKEYEGKMNVVFIDVWKNEDAGKAYGIQTIPTQIFFDPAGKELYRHTGFFAKEDILAKWKELGFDFGAASQAAPTFSRWDPAQPDTRPKDAVCYLCNGNIDPKTRTVMKTPAGDVAFCSPHCYLITYASLTDANKTHDNASVTDWATGALVPATQAKYLHGMEDKGHPSVKAFVDEAAAKAEQAQSGGNVLDWALFEQKEMTTRCGFCDRPVYPEDASVVRVDGMQTWGCCVMCALGVAARTGKDIEVETKDALTGAPIRVKTFGGHVQELEPPTAVAWAGAKKDAEGKIVSTGCFKQAFFTDEANLKKWVEQHPAATGQQTTIEQALSAKMKLTPEQISKACKIGECKPN